MKPKERVLKKFPKAHLERNADPFRQKYFIWRDNSGRIMTEDYLGCGSTPQNAWRDVWLNKVVI